jgi:hypothetical protein
VPDRRHRETDRPLLADRRRVVVAHGVALGDRSGSRDHAGAGEQGLGERRLAGAGRADQHDVADLGRIVHSDRACRVAVFGVFAAHGTHTSTSD